MNREQWKYSIIKKFLGNQIIDPEFLTRALRHQWHMNYDIIQMENGFLTFKFNCKDDQMMVKGRGHGQLLKQYLLWRTGARISSLLKLSY